LGAQAVYLSAPLLKNILPTAQLGTLARTLEDANQTQAFVSCLREAHTQ
jgi:hypothetical protein